MVTEKMKTIVRLRVAQTELKEAMPGNLRHWTSSEVNVHLLITGTAKNYTTVKKMLQ